MPVLEVIPRGHVMRELSTEIARLTNEMAGLRATPAVPQGRSVWLLFREDDESDAVMMYFEKPDETGFKDRFKLREFVLVERATPAPVPAAGILDCAEDDEGAIALYERPQEVGLTDEEIANMACAVAAICTGTSARTVAATAIEWTERALRAKGGKL